MAPTSKTAVNIVFGAMTLGNEGAEQARVHDLGEAGKILDTFVKYGHNEIDTARTYGGGSSEEYLGKLDWQKRGIVMDTKFSPRQAADPSGIIMNHSPEGLREAWKRSSAALKTDKVDMWYLHAPDRTTPYEVTIKVVNDMYKEGKFNRFGISNYMSWEVAQICELCNQNGWVKPVAYQGVYNALHRAVEPELFPCLRKYGIAFYEFNPLAGGFLTDRYHREDDSHETGARFDPNRNQGKNYRRRYWNDTYFDALEILRAAAKKHGLSEAECALRWITNHSMLKREHGDAVIIGASSAKQLDDNLANLEKGPLPDDVVEALDEAWKHVKGVCGNYFH